MPELPGQGAFTTGRLGERPLGPGEHGVDGGDPRSQRDRLRIRAPPSHRRRGTRRPGPRTPHGWTVSSSRRRRPPARPRSTASPRPPRRRRAWSGSCRGPRRRAADPPVPRAHRPSQCSRRRHRSSATSASVVRASVGQPLRSSAIASRSDSSRREAHDGAEWAAPANRPRARATKRPWRRLPLLLQAPDRDAVLVLLDRTELRGHQPRAVDDGRVPGDLRLTSPVAGVGGIGEGTGRLARARRGA